MAAGIEHGTFGTPFLEFTLSTLALVAAFRTKILKGTLSDLRQFLAAESALKMMKNAFYF